MEEKQKISSNIEKMFHVNFDLKKDERCLILSDLPNEIEMVNKTREQLNEMYNRTLLAKEFYEICKNYLTEKVDFKTFIGRGISGTEPPNEIAALLFDYDVIVMLTTHSLSHTIARKKASATGARIASMPGFVEKMLLSGGPMDVDYNKISKETMLLAELGNKAKHVKIEFPEGHVFNLDKGDRKFLVDDGLYISKGSFGNLPAGETFCAPIEGSAEGTLFVRKGWHPNLSQDMLIHVKKGLVNSIQEGGKLGDYLSNLLALNSKKEIENNRRNIAELGIGTNQNAKNPNIVLESEKIKGTVHIALGDNFNFGGKVSADIHLDFVFPEINLWFDELKILDKGKWLINKS